MPAILRIFLYQTDASLSLLGLCGSYDQSRGSGPPDRHRVYGSHDYAVVNGVLEVYAIQPIGCHCT